MKLYLSSYGLGNSPGVLKSLVGANKRAAVIVNAQDALLQEERDQRVVHGFVEMTALGFTPEELDLRNYFDNPEKLPSKLREYGLLWIRGGNSFVLRRAMQQSGFDTAIKPLVMHDEIVYAGFSAGSCVATPSLYGIELVDNPHTIPKQYHKDIVWEGLNFFGKSIAPHYRSDHPETDAVEKSVEYFEEQGTDYVALHDGEVIVVDDQGPRVIG